MHVADGFLNWSYEIKDAKILLKGGLGIEFDVTRNSRMRDYRFRVLQPFAERTLAFL